MFGRLKNWWKLLRVEASGRTKLLAESNYGRDFGWYIEYEGAVIGELDECKWCDMFWDRYCVTPSSGVGETLIRNDDLWNECRFHFRNRRLDEYPLNAFCGGTPPFVDDGKITMRALYLLPENKSQEKAMERLVAKLRRRS
jgi:hypothetical protein